MPDLTKIFPKFSCHYFLNTVTDSLTVAQVSSELKNVITSLSTVFGTISDTIKLYPILGSLTVDVQEALSTLKVATAQLVQTILYVSSSENSNVYEQVNKAVGSVTVAVEELIKSGSEVAATVAATIAIETKEIIHAVSALCTDLYTALKVVLHVVVTTSDLFTQLTTDVFHALHAVATMLTDVIKSVTSIILGISQAIASVIGTVPGFTSNISYISISLAEMCSKFSSNLNI